MNSHTGARRNVWQIAIATCFAITIVALTVIFADPASPLLISNVDNPDPVVSGTELTYTITATNTGGAKLTAVKMSSQLNGVAGLGPLQQYVLSSTRGSCTQNINLVTCEVGTLPGGGNVVITIRGIVTAAGGETLNNTATFTGTKSAQNFTTTGTASTLVVGSNGTPLPDLTIAKAGPTSVATNTPMIYTLTVNNLGTANASNIKVVDTLPAGVFAVSTSTTSLFTCTNNEGLVPAGSPITVTCLGGAVNAGANASISINATSPVNPATITNTAAVDPDQAITESNELNNGSSLVNTDVGLGVPQGKLTIDKTDFDVAGPDWTDEAGPDPIRPGDIVTYKILVRNTSDFRADDVWMVDGTQALDAASLYIDQVISNGTVGHSGGCFVAAPEVKCLARTLNAGGQILYTVKGRVVGTAGTTIINTATVTGNIQNKGVKSTDTERTTVRPGVDLTVTKTDEPDPACASSWPTTAQGGANAPPTAPPMPIAGPVCLGGIKYTVTIGNSGVDPVTGNLVLRDELPPGTILDHFTDLDGAFPLPTSCLLGLGNVVTCSGGSIGAAQTKRVVFYVVAPPSVGSIVNKVTVDPANAIFESDETNNDNTAPTTISTGVDLTIVKDDKPPKSPEGFDPIATGGTQTYTIVADNLGPQTATNVMIRDVLPANTIFRDAIADPGSNFTCSHSNGVVDCVGGRLLGTYDEFYDGGDGAAGEQHATIKIRVFAQKIVGTMHNEVRIDPLNAIPEINELNNIDIEDTEVRPGGHGTGAFNEFIIDKKQTFPTPVGAAVARNAKMIFHIQVTNDGTDPATGVTVRDFIPAGSRYIEATGTNRFLCKELANFIECTGGELGKFGSGTETATIVLSLFAPDTPGTYTNQAIVDPDNAIAEGNEFNNEDNESFDVTNGGIAPFIDLTITKVSQPPTVKPKQQYKYLLTVKNLGSNPALNVAVDDVLPPGVVFVEAKDTTAGSPGSAFTCALAGGVVKCTGATIDGTEDILGGSVPDTRTIEIVVKAPNQNATNPPLLNQAFVDPDNLIFEGDELNNSATATTVVQSVINLRITKTGPTESNQSQTSTYTLTVYNDKPEGSAADGGEDAFGIKVIDNLPIGLIPLDYQTSAGSNFSCSFSENPINVFECVGDLKQNTNVVITIDVFMTAEGGRSLDNEACVDPDDTIEEFNETDNCSTAVTLTGGTPPKAAPDLLVVKSVSPSGPVTAGNALTYTITISNVGTAKAYGPETAAGPPPVHDYLKLTDTLPDHVTFGNFETTNGWDCTFSAPTLTCHEGDESPGVPAGLDVGASATITIHATYDGDATQPIVNTATADAAFGFDDSTDDEKEMANNTATAKNSVGTTGIDLVLSKIVDLPDPVTAGQVLTYTVVAVNGGTEDSNTGGNQVKVRLDYAPSGLTFISAVGTNGFTCDPPSGNQIVCTGDLPAGGDTTITAKFVVLGGSVSAISLTAKVDSDTVITETNETNNEATEPTTVITDGCPGPAACIDLVAAQLVGSPDPYANNGTVTMSFVLVNTGDTATTLDPDPANGQYLAWFDVSGAHTGSSRVVTPTSPGVSVVCEDQSNTASALLSNCFGNLGPGEGVVITVTFTGVTAPTVSATGTADPSGLVTEFLETNNVASKTVNKQP